MEEILLKCCKTDNESIQQGTKEIKEALKKPEAIAALCSVVVNAQDAQIRQYAAVVLGRRLAKYKHWAKLTAEDRSVIKDGILRALANEPHKPVRNSIAYFIGAIMKHEAAKGGWPELFEVLFTLPVSEDPAQREMGLYLLSILVDMNAKLFAPLADRLCALILSVCKGEPDGSVGLPVFYAIDILKSLALGTTNVQVIVNTGYEVIPIIVKAIYALLEADEERAIKFIQLLDHLSDGLPTTIDPHVKLVVKMCLDIARENRLGEEVRMKAMAFLGLFISKKKKALLKHELVQPILDTLFFVVATPPEDPEDYDDEEDNPSTVANQTLDSLALYLPPGKVVTPMLQRIEEGIESPQPFHRKAACLSMAVMAEGCADYIRTKHLKTFVMYVVKGIQDELPVVRNAALFALGQFSEHLQPDISQYADEVMPLLFSYLDNLCQVMNENGKPDNHPAHISRMFYALEMFCENLDEGLTPHLEAVVTRLLHILKSPYSVKVRELAISSLNSAASAAKEQMAVYVPQILEALHGFLTQPQDEEMLSLQIHSVDTLAVLARSLGKENFRPLVNESLQIAMTLVEKVDDPDLRKTVYGLLGALSAIMETGMQGVLEPVVTVMLGALKSEEGNAVLDLDDRDENQFAIYDDVSETDNEEDIEDESERSDDLDGCQVHVEDAFTEEKAEACSALGELAKNTGVAFLPYFEGCMTLLVSMIGHPAVPVRVAALDAFSQLTAALGKTAPEKEQDQQKALAFIVPKCVEIIQTDYDRDVVAAALDALDTLLTRVKSGVLQAEGHTEAIVNSILQVLSSKTPCQDDDEGTTIDGDSEQDEIIYEYAGNLIPALGIAMPKERFLELFKVALPLLLSKAQDHNSSAQKSFVAGTLAETLELLDKEARIYFHELLPVFLRLIMDEEEEVRNNAFFALGELVLYSGDTAFESYPTILIQLSQAISKETAPANLDNICGAIARMIIANASLIPLESVLPVFVEKLPLRKDFEENLSVFQSLNHLYQLGNPTLRQLIPNIIRVAITVVYRKEHTKKETLENVVNLLTNIQRDFPADFQAATSEISEEQLQVLQERLA